MRARRETGPGPGVYFKLQIISKFVGFVKGFTGERTKKTPVAGGALRGFLGCRRAAGAASAGRAGGRRLLRAPAVAVSVPPLPLQGKAGLGDQLLDLATASGAGGSRRIGKFLAQLKGVIAAFALVLVKWHRLYYLLLDINAPKTANGSLNVRIPPAFVKGLPPGFVSWRTAAGSGR